MQRWAGETQVGLVGSTLTIRRPDYSEEHRVIDRAELGEILEGEFGLMLDADEVEQLAAQLSA